MAGVRDTLETMLVLTGAAAYVSGMNQAARAAMGLAQASGQHTAAAAQATGAVKGMAAALPELLVGLAAVKAGVDLLSNAFHGFAEEQDQLFRTSIIFRNLGVNLPIERLQAFSDQLSRTTGLSRAEFEGAAGILARVGVSGDRMGSILKTIADTARGTGKSVSEVAELIEIGAEGQARGLKRLGVQFEDTHSKAMNLFLIQQQLNRNFGGAGAAFLNTPQGALDNLTRSVTQFMAALGQELGPQITSFLRGLASGFDFLTAHMHQIVRAVELLSGPFGWFEMWIGRQHPERRNPAAALGKNQPATESTLQQVADNTKQMADSVEMRVLGGSGAQVSAGFGWQAARHAMMI